MNTFDDDVTLSDQALGSTERFRTIALRTRQFAKTLLEDGAYGSEISDQICFLPHLWLKVERDIPRPIFVVALIGVPSLLMVGIPRLISLDFLGEIIRSHYAGLRDDEQGTRIVPCFGRVLGYYYHYRLGCCQEFSVEGEFVGHFDGVPKHYGEVATLQIVEDT